MAEAQPVPAVKLIAVLLWRDASALAGAIAALRQRWGPTDFEGRDRPFDASSYYEAEMGPALERRLVAFSRLMAPEALVAAKLAAREVEIELSGPRGRTVNIDAGYLDLSKVVLASFKLAGQKIHLGGGVWADMTLRFEDGKYRPFAWTFPDFRDGRYDEDLLAVRRLYRDELRAVGR